MPDPRHAALLTLACVLSGTGGACSSLRSSMRQMQGHTDALGSAVAVKDGTAAARSLDAVEGTLARIKAEYPTRGQIQLADVATTILDPAIPPVRQAVAAPDWPAAERTYLGLVDACNRCHAATGNERFVVKPVGVR